MLDVLLEILLFPIGDLAVWLASAMSGEKSRPREVRSAATGSCAYCRRRGGGFVACSSCRAQHHADCARFNGRCAVYGCRNRSFRVPAA